MSLLRVAVIYGGPSLEHEVSLKTGKEMLAGLNKELYDITPVLITKEGLWKINKSSLLTQDKAINELKKYIDVCMIGLHGAFGEDGQIQLLLEKMKLSFTGSGSKSSKLAMEKHLASMQFSNNGLNTPKELAINAWSDSLMSAVEKKLDMPIVVKPQSQGSSVGVSIVSDIAKLNTAVKTALTKDSVVLLQQFIKGREVSCGVLDVNGELLALPPTEVEPINSEFYDYDAKYDIGATKETTPPRNMGKTTIKIIQEIALKAHNILGCSGYSRTDIIISENSPFIIETNTLPGMTATSFLPQQIAAIGMSFPELLDNIINSALRK